MLNLTLRLLFSVFRNRQALVLENATLRLQIEVLQRNSNRPRLLWRDRAFWDLLSCVWPDWRRSLYIVQPETVFRWHRKGFRGIGFRGIGIIGAWRPHRTYQPPDIFPTLKQSGVLR